MRKLIKNVEYYIEMYFDKKIKGAKLPDDVFDEIWDLVSDAEERIEDILDDVDRKIDDIVEEHTPPEIPSFSESIRLDQLAREDALARENDLYSIKNDYYLTR